MNRSAASPTAHLAPRALAEEMHQSDAVIRPAREAAGRATVDPQKRAAHLGPAGRRSSDRDWRAPARLRSWGRFLLAWRLGAHVRKFIGQPLTEMLPCAMDV